MGHWKSHRYVKDIKEEYEWETQLGAGSFGTVHEATSKVHNERVALKVIAKTKVKEDKLFEDLMKQEL